MQYINAFCSFGEKITQADIITHCTSTDVNSNKFFKNKHFMTLQFSKMLEIDYSETQMFQNIALLSSLNTNVRIVILTIFKKHIQ